MLVLDDGGVVWGVSVPGPGVETGLAGVAESRVLGGRSGGSIPGLGMEILACRER